MATIGILVTGNPSPEAFLEGFGVALRAAGLIESQNIRLEVRSAEGNDTLLPQKATELVRLKVDVIVASLTPAVQAARQVTSEYWASFHGSRRVSTARRRVFKDCKRGH